MHGQYTLDLGGIRSPRVLAERFAIYRTQSDTQIGIVRINLGNGLFAQIDEADAALVWDYAWFAEKRGLYTWYAVRNARKHEGERLIRMHQQILGAAPEGLVIDHIDCDGLNNRRSNIRFVTPSENSRNIASRISNSSGYTGVSFHKASGRWRADIFSDGRPRSLGTFSTAEEAAIAYDMAVRARGGAIIRVNYPKEGEFPTSRLGGGHVDDAGTGSVEAYCKANVNGHQP